MKTNTSQDEEKTANNGQAEEESTNNDPLMIEDTRLKRAYSIMEIATLAAGCRGDTPAARIEEAIQLLSAVEWSATTRKEEKLRAIIRNNMASRGVAHEATPKNLDAKVKVFIQAREEYDRWVAIFKAAKRDDATGKILRSSLVEEICYADGAIKTPEHAGRMFTEWVKSEFQGQGEYTDLTESAWVKLYKSQFESDDKTRLIHDDEAAMFVVQEFLWWLGNRPKVEQPKPIHSQQGDDVGDIVSPKTRGAERADESVTGTSKKGNKRKRGQYTTKPQTATEEHAVPRRKSRTRMDGNRPN